MSMYKHVSPCDCKLVAPVGPISKIISPDYFLDSLVSRSAAVFRVPVEVIRYEYLQVKRSVKMILASSNLAYIQANLLGDFQFKNQLY